MAFFYHCVDFVADKAFNVAYSLANNTLQTTLNAFGVASTHHSGSVFVKNARIFCGLCKFHDFVEVFLNSLLARANTRCSGLPPV